MSKVAHLKCCSSSCTLMGSCTLIWMVNAAVCTARRRLSSPLDLPAPAAGPACVRAAGTPVASERARNPEMQMQVEMHGANCP